MPASNRPPVNLYAPPMAEVRDVAPVGTDVLATRTSRLFAALIDGLISAACAWLAMTLLGLSLTRLGGSGWGTLLGVTLVNLMLYLLINGWLLHTEGQTVGKKLLSIRIVRTNGQRASLGRLVGLRLVPVWVMSVIPGVGQLLVLLDSLAIFGSARRCVHDRLADTLVVRA